MTFDLTLSSSDLLLLAPEIFLTIWLCVVLAVDFTFKQIDHEKLAYLSVGGVIATLINLIWFDYTGVEGALFKDMFVLDGVAIFFKILVLISTVLVLLASIDYVKSFKFFRGEYYFLVMMSALGMMFMASAQDLLSVFVTLEFSTFGFYVLVAYLREDQKSSE
ncbi:MAG: NADH-quinone oxidoreductase subunit N, partial [Nitrospira sp. SB0672_bin_25]|nr:NADH-quinone oxidoreductase subunit N [Nitrospira sp. SB0672_bin_25]